MANSFNKEEIVDFEMLLEGFEDQLVLSRHVNKFSTDQTQMARSNDTIWRPQPYIMTALDGVDQTGNFGDKVQLAVPSTINIFKSANFNMSESDYRDAVQENRLSTSAAQALASIVNVSIMEVASNQGSLVVTSETAATGYDDVALCEAVCNEQGVMYDNRYLALSTRDYNGMAGNLAARQTFDGDVSKAYKKSYVGEIASFETFKLDYANRIGAAGGGAITMSTLDAATNYYEPAATVATVNGTNNVDNRYQSITVSATAGVAVGDAFTIAGVEAVHHITKGSTGELKTFRVVEVTNGTTLKITPPIVSNQVVSNSGTQYQNCEVTGNAAAAITWLNIKAANINPFWRKDALEIIPGKIAVPEAAGMDVMRGTTENGIEIVMSKQVDINTLQTKIRYDVFFGVNNLAPEQSGIMIFNQA